MKILFLLFFGCLLLSGLYAQSMFYDQEDKSSFEGGLGVTWIDGKSYTTFSLTPDISIGNFGAGLNIELLFDNEGGFSFRKTGWNKGAGILRAIRYLRWGYKFDPVYVRVGTLDAATLGHGFLMWYYSNEADYDQRKIGLEFDLDFEQFGFESVASNVLNVEIYGGRLYYRPLLSSDIPVIKNLEIGLSFVTDRDPDNFNDTDDQVFSWAGDIGIPIIRSDIFATTIYYDYAKFTDFGSGQVVGVDFGFPDVAGVFSLGAKLERRFLGDQFLPNYFNTLYELERTIPDGPVIKSKRQQLQEAKATEGLFGQLAGNIAGKVRLMGSFQKLNGVENSGILHLEAKMPDLIPNVRLMATYDKTGIETFEDARTLDVRSVATAEIGYRTYQFIVISMLYRWNFIEKEPNVFVPQERVEPRISFSYTF